MNILDFFSVFGRQCITLSDSNTARLLRLNDSSVEFNWMDLCNVNSNFLTETWRPEQLLPAGAILTGLLIYLLVYSFIIHFEAHCHEKLQFVMNTTEARNLFVNSIKPVNNAPQEKDLIKIFEKLIEKNLMSDNFTIARISKEIGLSKSGFTKKIKDLTGLPPKKYIIDYKLKKSKELLLKNNVSDTSILLGFYDAKTFGRMFKRKFGMPPSKYRIEALSNTGN